MPKDPMMSDTARDQPVPDDPVSSGAGLTIVADELYGLVPAQFTAARDARAGRGAPGWGQPVGR